MPQKPLDSEEAKRRGRRLKVARERLRLSQEQIGRQIDRGEGVRVGRTQLGAWERGEQMIPEPLLRQIEELATGPPEKRQEPLADTERRDQEPQKQQDTSSAHLCEPAARLTATLLELGHRCGPQSLRRVFRDVNRLNDDSARANLLGDWSISETLQSYLSGRVQAAQSDIKTCPESDLLGIMNEGRMLENVRLAAIGLSDVEVQAACVEASVDSTFRQMFRPLNDETEVAEALASIHRMFG